MWVLDKNMEFGLLSKFFKMNYSASSNGQTFRDEFFLRKTNKLSAECGVFVFHIFHIHNHIFCLEELFECVMCQSR